MDKVQLLTQCVLCQVTTVEVMEALNRLLRRSKGPDRNPIRIQDIVQSIADVRDVDPMVRLLLSVKCDIMLKAANAAEFCCVACLRVQL